MELRGRLAEMILFYRFFTKIKPEAFLKSNQVDLLVAI